MSLSFFFVFVCVYLFPPSDTFIRVKRVEQLFADSFPETRALCDAWRVLRELNLSFGALQVAAPRMDMTLTELQEMATRQQQQIDAQQQLLASKVDDPSMRAGGVESDWRTSL